ncbi:hypothetical protein [Vibrio splendidus]|uniref:hypothetical protein n=1 Tax=Vibrio splendidus TaxID=29497 RepID=UPI0011B24F0C|nr:hypothetical protein [Vibrio splendidus]
MEGFYNLWKRLYTYSWDKNTRYFITLDFSSCNFAGVNLTAIVGSFVCFVKEQLIYSDLRIETKSMSRQVHYKLRNMGLLESLDRMYLHGFTGKTEDIIPYREFPHSTKEQDVLTYLKRDWLGKNRLNFSETVESSVLSSLWEVYANALEHSGTQQVQSCGSYNKKDSTLSLLVGDSGSGIIHCVQQYLASEIGPIPALEWALTKGNSTYTVNLKEEGLAQPRGLGFHLLTQLVDINEGQMEVYTGSIFYVRKNKQNFYSQAPIPVKGSWVKLTLQCKQDEIYYFVDEDEEIPDYV